MCHVYHMHVHNCMAWLYLCVNCTRLVHIQWSTYSDPHPCVLLQIGSLCRYVGLCKIDHLSTKSLIFSYLLHDNLITIDTNTPKSFITTKLNGLSFAIYRNGILHLELKILTKIQLVVICNHMVDFLKPSHKSNV